MPSSSLPDDYQHVEDKVGPAIELLGRQISGPLAGGFKVAGDVYNQVAKDRGVNQYQDQLTKLYYGDPSKPQLDETGKPVMGPNDQPLPDTGYNGMGAERKLRYWPELRKQLDELRQQISNGLPGGSRVEFANSTSRMNAAFLEKGGAAADDAAKIWAQGVNKTTYENSLNAISVDPGNDTAFKNHMGDMINANVKDAHLVGASSTDDPIYKSAVERGTRDAWKARILAVGVTDPQAGMKMIEDNRDKLGQDYAPLQREFQDKAKTARSQDLAAKTFSMTRGANAPAAALTNPSNPIYTKVATAIPGGFSAGGLPKTVSVESGGRAIPNPGGTRFGPAQVSLDLVNKYAPPGADPNDPEVALMVTQRYAADNRKQLAATLGRDPASITDTELYIAHQQGAGGAANLFLHPQARAVSVVGLKEVTDNGGSVYTTSQQFSAFLAQKYNGAMPGSIHQMPGRGLPSQMDLPAVSKDIKASALVVNPARGRGWQSNPQMLSGVSGDLKEVVGGGVSMFEAANQGWHVYVNDGFNPSGHAAHSQHHRLGSGALDMVIVGPNGEIKNEGPDPTGKYTELAKDVFAYAKDRRGDLIGKLAWGGAFGTHTGGTVRDLMHFDLGGERGSLGPLIGGTKYSGGGYNATAEARRAAVPMTPASISTDMLSVKEAGFQSIMENPNYTNEEKLLAVGEYSRLEAASQMADGQSQIEKRDRNEKAAGGYMTAIVGGAPAANILSDIAKDQSLLPDTKEALTRALEAHAHDSQAAATAEYGPAYWPIFQQILKPVGDPSRISDIAEILGQVKPGQLSIKGAEDLARIATSVRKDVDQASINQAKEAQMKYLVSRVTFDEQANGAVPTPGVSLRRDPDVNSVVAKAITRYNREYADYTKDGKNNPYDFFTQKKTDEIAANIRSPRDFAVAKLAAEEAQVQLPQDVTLPPAPDGVDKKGWEEVMKLPAIAPIVTPKGNPMSVAQWQELVQRLIANPNESNRAWFDKYIGPTFKAAVADPDIQRMRPSDLVLAALGVDAGALPPDLRPSTGAPEVGVPAAAATPVPTVAGVASGAAAAGAPPAPFNPLTLAVEGLSSASREKAAEGTRRLETPGVGPPTLPPPDLTQPLSAFSAPQGVPTREFHAAVQAAQDAVVAHQPAHPGAASPPTVTTATREVMARAIRKEYAKNKQFSAKDLDRMTEETLREVFDQPNLAEH
jgi:hypothetical protein